MAIGKQKNNRAPGEDVIFAELFKNGGQSLFEALHNITVSMWEKKVMPKEWNTDLIYPIFKKGDNFFFHWLYSSLWPWPLYFSFMIILQTVGLLGRVISSSQGLYLNTGQHKHRINICTHQTSMLCVGFEPMVPASEGAKTVHALDCSATVTGKRR
jgi:hypothetical protein